MFALIFQNDDGVRRVLPVTVETKAEAISAADDIIRKFVAGNCPDVDVDFEESAPGCLLPGDNLGWWAIGSQGEYFELWVMSTPEDL